MDYARVQHGGLVFELRDIMGFAWCCIGPLVAMSGVLCVVDAAWRAAPLKGGVDVMALCACRGYAIRLDAWASVSLPDTSFPDAPHRGHHINST